MVATTGKLLVLYGSQTGTTAAFAKIVYSFARARNFDAKLASGAAFDPKDLLKEDILKKIRFTVFGLGNATTKGNFCVAAKRLQSRMLELGAFEFVPSVFSDEYAEDGHEGNFKPWLKTVWTKLTGSDIKLSLPRHFTVTSTSEEPSAQKHADGFLPMSVASNEVITPSDYDRPVHLVTFKLPPGVTYELCDHVQIKPENAPGHVVRLLRRLGLSGSTIVSLQATDEIAIDLNLPLVISVQELLSRHLDISSPPTRSFLEGISALASSKSEAAEIEILAENMKPGNEYSRLTGGGPGREPFSLVDALERFPSIKISLEDILGNVQLLQPRFYSICSAPSVSPNKIQICFLDEQWSSTANATLRFQGVSSGFLTKLAPGANVVARIQRGLLNLPTDPATPLLSVALGTGIAVFRGILQHRESLLQKDPHCGVSRMRLYYGMRHANRDYLFEKEMNSFVQNGLLEIIPACSHDQAQFITPATRIMEFPEKVGEYLDNGGYYLFCGLGGLIPTYHEQSIISALQTSRGITAEAAYGDVENLKELSRWQVEAYSRSMDDDNQLKNLITKDQTGEKPVAEEMGQGDMFCFQCGQTATGKGCTTIGVCGKTPTVAALQDLLVDGVKRLSWYAHRLRTTPGATDAEKEDAEVNRFTLLATFSTLTNVNFDETKISAFVATASKLRMRLKLRYSDMCKRLGLKPERFPLSEMKQNTDKVMDIEDLVSEGKKVGVLTRFRASKNDALVGLQEMLVYGLKGLAAYTDHSLQYGNERPEIYAFIHEAFSFLLSPDSAKLDEVLGMLMKCGQVNLIALELLHNSNNVFGQQSPFIAPAKPKPGKCILISGHDLKILGDILVQCAAFKVSHGVHINVFTHGEMLPAFGYPKLRESPHLAGHFGVAWQRQSLEFAHFPGPIIMTSNCLTKPKDEYKDRIYTIGPVGWPGIPHLENDYSVLLTQATAMAGFEEGVTKFTYPENTFTSATESYNVGWGSETVIGAAGTVLEAVSAGLITRFYVIGGCDGYEGERSYYTDLAAALPETSVVLTVGCGKFRVNHLQYGTVGDSGIPRLLDLGQCNDSYSAVQIALALANALGCGVNDLPLSIVLSWFEQKAVVVLLSLLSLGIRNIRVGPSVPAFLRPSIVKVLNEKFNLMPIGADVQADIEKMVAGEK
ncbi:hypothetical protein HDU98_009203 [Podochytrium sp. JEL0797]|nr:hypothetical protein HDU98_009203 [Podochytrium sp. JEL0797]